MSQATAAEVPDPDSGPPGVFADPDGGGAERVVLQEIYLERARASSWQRRWEAESDRCEQLEAAFQQTRAELAMIRRDCLALRQQVDDRDAEIRALKGAPPEGDTPAG